MDPSPRLLADYAPVMPVPGCPGIVAHQAADVFALWTAWETESRRPRDVPYWATVWPAARVMAAWILAHDADVKGKTVLDLGCGGAIVAIAAARAGAAAVVANDIDPVALHVAGRNAAANGVAIACSGTNLLAPSTPDAHPTPCEARPAQVVFVADLFYQRELAARATAFLTTARALGVRVVIADGGRPFAPRESVSVLCRETVPVDRRLEGVNAREVAILEFT